MSDVFMIHGWREDKAVFEVELLLKSWIECEDVQGISSIFNTQLVLEHVYWKVEDMSSAIGICKIVFED